MQFSILNKVVVFILMLNAITYSTILSQEITQTFLNRSSFDHEWELDLQNMTNRENIFIQNWDNNKKEAVTHYQMGFMPMMTYRIYF